MYYLFDRDWLFKVISIYGVALVSIGILVPIVIWLSIKFRIIDIPNARKIHTIAVPRTGGLAIFISFIISILFIYDFAAKIDMLLIASSIVFIVGFLDDIFNINAIWKLAALIVGTFILAYFGDIHSEIFKYLPADIILTCLWVVGITSAFNALDHMDGLLSGVVLIGVLMFFLVSVQTGQYEWSLINIGLIGAVSGFLIFNYPAAKIFMGDGGSFFLGFIMGVSSVMGGWSTHPFKAAIIPVIILIIPIIDFAFVIIKRIILKQTNSFSEIIKYSAKDHIGHRLLDMGLTTKQSLFFIYFLSFTIGIAAVALRNSKPFEAFLILLICINISLLFIVSIYYFKLKRRFRKEIENNKEPL